MGFCGICGGGGMDSSTRCTCDDDRSDYESDCRSDCGSDCDNCIYCGSDGRACGWAHDGYCRSTSNGDYEDEKCENTYCDKHDEWKVLGCDDPWDEARCPVCVKVEDHINPIISGIRFTEAIEASGLKLGGRISDKLVNSIVDDPNLMDKICSDEPLDLDQIIPSCIKHLEALIAEKKNQRTQAKIRMKQNKLNNKRLVQNVLKNQKIQDALEIAELPQISQLKRALYDEVLRGILKDKILMGDIHFNPNLVEDNFFVSMEIINNVVEHVRTVISKREKQSAEAKAKILEKKRAKNRDRRARARERAREAKAGTKAEVKAEDISPDYALSEIGDDSNFSKFRSELSSNEIERIAAACEEEYGIVSDDEEYDYGYPDEYPDEAYNDYQEPRDVPRLSVRWGGHQPPCECEYWMHVNRNHPTFYISCNTCMSVGDW